MAFSTHDQVPDSPTNVFATLNPLFISDGTNQNNPTNGNLYLTTTSAGREAVRSTFLIPKNSGKWYWEFVTDNNASGSGITINQYTDINDYYYGDYNWVYYGGGIVNNASQVTALSSTPSTNTVIGVMVDLDNNLIYFYSGGSSLGSASITSNQDWIPIIGDGSGAISANVKLNFGQDHTFGGYPNSLASSSGYSDANGYGSFYYDPTQIASDVKALCTANLPDPDIDPAVDDLPEDYFKAVTYTGNGGTQSITGAGFQPDLVWCKNRTTSGSNHRLFDSIRGASSVLYSSLTNAAATDATGLTSFDSTGFSIGANQVNDNNANFVAWCFRAGGAPTADNTATSGAMTANSVSVDGTLQSSYTPSGSPAIYPKRMSVNTKAGFSIVKYSGNSTSGATIPHGLSSAPEFVIIKNLTDSVSAKWGVFHKDSISSGVLYLDDTAAAASADTNVFNSLNASTISTINTITIGNYNGTNGNGDEHIMYAFTSIPGYSAFGSYTGNGSATDGPFIYTGFKPALIWIKCTSDSTTTHTSWSIYDNAREPNNEMNKPLYANQSAPEGERGNGTTDATDIKIDFLSNGFRILTDKEELNDDGETYIFCCWAEMPQKYANAR